VVFEHHPDLDAAPGSGGEVMLGGSVLELVPGQVDAAARPADQPVDHAEAAARLGDQRTRARPRAA
jgi:hypothetical protein